MQRKAWGEMLTAPPLENGWHEDPINLKSVLIGLDRDNKTALPNGRGINTPKRVEMRMSVLARTSLNPIGTVFLRARLCLKKAKSLQPLPAAGRTCLHEHCVPL